MAFSLVNIGLSTTNINIFDDDLPTIVNSGAFQNVSSIASIKIPNATSIENLAFYGCSNLLSVVLPGLEYGDIDLFGDKTNFTLNTLSILEGTTNLGTNLANLQYLRNFNFPTTLTTLVAGALENCDIYELNLNAKVHMQTDALKGSKINNLSATFYADTIGAISGDTSIKTVFASVGSENTVLKAGWFSDCNMQDLSIAGNGQGIESIDQYAFENCKYLISVNLENSSIEYLPASCFYGTQSLISIVLPNTLGSLQKDCLINSSIPQISLPDSLTGLAYVGKQIQYDHIPTGIQQIDESALVDCILLNASANLSNVQYIGNSAFSKSNVSAITIHSSSLTAIPDTCFLNCDSLETVGLDMENCEVIGTSAFTNCNSLQYIQTNAHLKHINDFAFCNCNLNSMEGLATVSSIGSYAFKNSNIEGMTLTSIEYIDDNAFENSTFRYMYLDDKIDEPTSFGQTIFNGCTRVKDIVIYDSIEGLNRLSVRVGGSLLIDYSSEQSRIDSTIAAHSKLKQLYGLSTDDFEVVLDDGTTINKDGSYGRLKCMILDENDSSILISCDPAQKDYQTFLRNQRIPNGILKISSDAFNAVKQDLTCVNLNSVKNINEGVFDSAVNMLCVYGDCVESLDENCFSNCTNLACAQLSSLKSVGQNCFSRCSKLSSINCSNSIQSIGNHAFDGTDFHEIQLENNGVIKDIGQYAFANNSQLRSFSFSKKSASLSVLNDGILSSDIALQELALPSSIRQISDNALKGLKSNGIKLSCISKSKDDFDSILQIDDTTKIGNKTLGLNNQSLIYTNDNDYLYPSYIIKSSKVYRIQNKAFVVDSNLNLNSFNVIYCNDKSCSEDQFINIEKIYPGAFGTSNFINVDLPPQLLKNSIVSEQQPLFENSSIEAVNVNGNYINGGYASNLWKLIFGNLESKASAKVNFNDGILSKTGFEGFNDVFKFKSVSTANDTIVGVNEENAKDNKNPPIPASCTQISSEAFSYDTQLTALRLYDCNINKIFNNAFKYNMSIVSVSLGENIQTLEPSAFAYSGISSINIPKSITYAEGYGLNTNYQLKEIKYDTGVISIQPSAMIDCVAVLTSIQFPSTLRTIGDFAFAEVADQFPRLKNVSFEDATSLTTIGKYAFYNSIQTLENDTLILPNSTLSIMDGAFGYDRYSYTQTLSNLDLDIHSVSEADCKNVNYIGPSAFIYNRLRSISFNRDKLKTIADYAFAYPKYKQSDLHIPSSIQSIKEGAFAKNVILNSNNIKKNLVFFDGIKVEKLQSIFDVEADIEGKAYNRAHFTDGTCLSALASDYLSGFVFIWDNLMNFCPKLLYIDILNKTLVSADNSIVTAYVPFYLDLIGPSAFYGCTKLRNIVDQDEKFGLTGVVNDYAFYNCKMLSNISLISTTYSIGKYSFYNCDSIDNFYSIDPDLANFEFYKLSSIDDNAFEDCSQLTVFDICSALTYLGNNAFDNCQKLANINIAKTTEEFCNIVDSTQEISANVVSKFYGVRQDFKCRINFTDATYTNDGYPKIDSEYVRLRRYTSGEMTLSAISAINYDLFTEVGQTYINLSSISRVDDFVFQGITQLKSISFLQNTSTEVNIDYIGDYAFANCTNLVNFNSRKLYCKDVGQYAFANCQSLMNIELDFKNLSSVGSGAFYNTSLNQLTIANCDIDESKGQTLAWYEQQIKSRIGFSTTDRNPLDLPEYCLIYLKDSEGNTIGKYDCLFNDLLYANIDINRNQLIFTDRTKDSVVPVMLVTSKDEDTLPSLAVNTFHANIIGRWK